MWGVALSQNDRRPGKHTIAEKPDATLAVEGCIQNIKFNLSTMVAQPSLRNSMKWDSSLETQCIQCQRSHLLCVLFHTEGRRLNATELAAFTEIYWTSNLHRNPWIISTLRRGAEVQLLIDVQNTFLVLPNFVIKTRIAGPFRGFFWHGDNLIRGKKPSGPNIDRLA